MIKYKKQYSLSEQQLLDCMKPENDCDGGDTGAALYNIKQGKVGLASDTDYPYFSGSNGGNEGISC